MLLRARLPGPALLAQGLHERVELPCSEVGAGCAISHALEILLVAAANKAEQLWSGQRVFFVNVSARAMQTIFS